MKVVVDYDRCKSHGKCMEAAPEVFELRDDGFLYVLDDEPPEELHARVEDAMYDCPTKAISLQR